MSKRKRVDDELQAFYEELQAEEQRQPQQQTAAAPAVDLSTMTVELVAKHVARLQGMPLPLQQALCDGLLPFAEPQPDDTAPSFFTADNEKTRKTDMLHLGKHYVGQRLRELGAVPLLIQRVAAEAQRVAAEGGLRLPCPPLETVDVAVVNAYRGSAKLGLHADRASARHPGTPVVAVSLGDSAEFVWKRSWRRSLPLERLVLRSGDVLIFGGSARGMVHGVERILEGSGPGELRLGADPGWRRVCITCREH
eukprot:Transcript_15813.p2 GENE.Transcript_15813~~Transcript_15813.p2  ORF type:complete len:252 (+),score=103.88 Transcript_15813:103-858(+)